MNLVENHQNLTLPKKKINSKCNTNISDKLISLSDNHINNFNLFLNSYLKNIPKTINQIYITTDNSQISNGLNPFYLPETYLKIAIAKIEIERPIRVDNEDFEGSDWRQFPKHARISASTYAAPIYVTYSYDLSDSNDVRLLRVFSGLCPILVKSDACNLIDLNNQQKLKYAGEDTSESGGYFIINGIEKLVRFVIQHRYNYPCALKKSNNNNVISMCCSNIDGTSVTNDMIYTPDNQYFFQIVLKRRQWRCPLVIVLKALLPKLQNELVKKKLIKSTQEKQFQDEIDMLWDSCIKNEDELSFLDMTQDRYLYKLGYFFYQGCVDQLKPGSTYADCGRFIIDNYILIHTTNWNEKLEIFLLMWNKLWQLKENMIVEENYDSPSYQQVLGSGELFASILKDSLMQVLQIIKSSYKNEIMNYAAASNNISDLIKNESFFQKIIEKVANIPSKSLQYFCSTGNIKPVYLDLQQTSGWCITANRLNQIRFIAQLRALHRGQFFAQSKLTTVRKLLGEAWGFFCPVHTPDGPLCGLYLHLAQNVVITSKVRSDAFILAVKDFLFTEGLISNLDSNFLLEFPNTQFSSIVIDGIVIAHLPIKDIYPTYLKFVEYKSLEIHGFDRLTEICYLDKKNRLFPGIYIFTSPCRMMRPVRFVQTKNIIWIGSLEQPWCDISPTIDELKISKEANKLQKAFIDLFMHENRLNLQKLKVEQIELILKKYAKDARYQQKLYKKYGINFDTNKIIEFTQNCPVDYKYVELKSTAFLSLTASLIPFSNFNQSPRNMYQCQMSKECMGTPFHNICWRTDNKTYRLITPSKPIVVNKEFNDYDLKYNSAGFNAVVAVISYTGFDMEDAITINRNALDRGLFDGCIYKSKIIDAAPEGTSISEHENYIFNNRSPSGEPIIANLDVDGLPFVGSKLTKNSIICRVENIKMKRSDSSANNDEYVFLHKYKDLEDAYVDQVRVIYPTGNRTSNYGVNLTTRRLVISLRCVRKPSIGDKFASRAAQKGILSLRYPTVDFPFSETGIVPDILFNPHGFPSRMTIGMMIESMAAKAGCLEGRQMNATPFENFAKNVVDTFSNSEYNKKNKVSHVDYFGEILQNNGFDYYGTETFHSGIHGTEMECKIFTGVIYYQRLRHMVSDKFNCRSTGCIDQMTRQPLKGRQRGGGIRLGEMERDALISYGAPSILRDRLLNCSDGHISYVCTFCGSIISVNQTKTKGLNHSRINFKPTCSICNKTCEKFVLPYIFRYLINELIVMSINLKIHLTEIH